ncbi:MAG: serine/threonine-protein kinase [Cyanobacteria bacterium P01_A01_bin.105]
MSYCINPRCPHRENPETAVRCQTCDTPLKVNHRYWLIRPLREIDEWEPSEIFEVKDENNPDTTKVLKVLKKPILLPLFQRETEILQQLSHPGIPRVEPDGYFPLDLADGRRLHCLIMENIQGVNLEDWLQQNGPLASNQAIDWLQQLAEILQQLHRAELFHRDIKLSNIMLRPTGQLALIDFGTVRPMTNTYLAKVAGKRDVTSVVSPGYTPLEQINGKAVPQSDFYALGRSLIYLLTGQHPIDLPEDETTGQIFWQDQTPAPVPPWLAQLLDDMMAAFPGQRPLSAEELLNRLTQPRLTQPQPSPAQAAPRPKIWLGLSKQRRLQLLVAANLVLMVIQMGLAWRWLSRRQAVQSAVAQTWQVPTGNRLTTGSSLHRPTE